MSDLADEFLSVITEGWRDKAALKSCSTWANHRRIMGGDFSGSYSDKFHPWVREIHNSKASFNYAMKGAQLGVTEVAINRALYTIDCLKRDVLYVLPTALNASDFSKSRFDVALELSPYLKSIFTNTNTDKLKQTALNTLYIRGSRGGGKKKAGSNLKSIPVSVLILDEVDEMEQRQIWLALERLSGQLIKYVLGISTPTIPNHGIDLLYMGSTQEHFRFQCPICSRHTEFVWPDCVEICGEHSTDARCADSFLKCKECKGKLEHADKPNFLKDAYWEATDKNANPDVRGFAISQLYSFTVTPGELVVAYHRGQGDEVAQKEFYNSKLGIPFAGDGARVTIEMIDRAVGDHTNESLRPLDANGIITMGIDRGKWNYVVIKQWFFDKWTLDINADAVCKVIHTEMFKEQDFDKRCDELMREWQVRACVGDADPGPMDMRRFSKRFPGYVWLCRYRRGKSAKEIEIDDRGENEFAPMATVDRTNWLSAALSRYKVSPARIMLPREGLSQDFKEHLQNLTSTYTKDETGNFVLDFVKTGPDHFAHASTYAEIALPLVAARETNVDLKKFNKE